MKKRLLIPAAVFLAAIFSTAAQTKAADGYVPFDGAKSDWHGFDRYDYLLDEKTMEIKPADPNTKGDTPGQRRCLVIVPKTPAAGNPWSWRGCWWDYMPQAEIELLKRGFHVVYVTGDREVLPDKRWDAWYAFLTEKHGLSKKPAFVGMSLGGEYSFMWAEAHPDEVSCIYADNPSSNEGILTGLDKLTSHDVPVLDICGSIDPTLGRWSVPIENIYHQFGGRISMMIKDGYSHHPHSLTDPAPIADFIEQSVKEKANPPAPMPDYAGDHATRGWYYSLENNFREFPKDDAWITYRGPIFTPTYAEYQASLGFPAPVTIIAPNKEAAGRPWVYRAGFVDRDAVADQALLAAGFHIVVGPVGYNEDGPIVDNWNKLYQHLVAHGFSKTPVIEGEGGGAGEAMNWAIANADKVSCIYCEDPLFRTHMNKVQPMDNLGPLAQAGVPILCVSGAQDPALAANTRAIEKKYGDLGGKVTVIVQEGVGRYPMGPKDTKPVVDFIVSHQPQK